MAETVTRTVWGSSLQTAMFYGIKLDIPKYSTINERHQVEATAILPDGIFPTIKYFGIGTGGARIVAGADGNPRTEEIQHQADDASLYKPFPFVLRSIDNDLTPLQRTKYAMRVIETFNNQQYVAYYLKRMDLSQAVLNRESRTINNGVTTSSMFTPTAANLVPTPPAISNEGANIITSDYIAVYSEVPMVFTKEECDELLNASLIIYGSEDYAIISEISICSGLDKVIQLPDSSNFNEAVCAQVVAFVATFHAIKFTNDGINGKYDVGVVEPLLKIQ